MLKPYVTAILFAASAQAVMAQTAAPPLELTDAAPTAAAPTVHAVLVGDTQDPTIGVGVTANLNKMRAFLRQVKDEGSITVVVKEVEGDRFSCSEILDAIRSIPATASDTVIFYYAGHGFRRADTQTQFPEFDCRRSKSPDRADLSGVTNSILKYGTPGSKAGPPRLVIAIADACNTDVLEEGEVPRQAGPRITSRPNRAQAYKQLFLQYSGTLLMSASAPGTEAWYLQTGGFFTTQLLGALDAHTRTPMEARWEAIADDAGKQMFIPKDTPTTQKPQVAPANLRLATAP